MDWWLVCLQVSELESAKQSLESVNDSLRLQLDEMREQGLEVEEMRVRGELEETQAALTAAEEDIKTYQQELSDTQVHARTFVHAHRLVPYVTYVRLIFCNSIIFYMYR